jgi:hypothetical protein
MAQKGKDKKFSGMERRKHVRRPVLDSFSLFVVVPKKGVHRLPIHDVSDHGLGFDLDTEGESFTDFPISSGEMIEVQFYLNQSLYIPIKVKVAQLKVEGPVRRVGVELIEKDGKPGKAYLAFVQMLDQIGEAAKIVTG